MTTGFTIAIPTHDRRETVLLAARSALAQTRAPEQVIVLCDGCTDGSAEALRTLGDERLEVLDLPKLPGYAYGHRNVALERARGDAILWLADDDLLLPDHLERLGEVWDAGEADLVSSPAVLVHPDDALEWIGADWGVPRFRSAMESGNSNVMASVSVRAALVREVGGWDPAQPRWADWELWRRCLAAGARAWTTDEPTVLHFRATGRVQVWPDRVRQNTGWWECVSDPAALPGLRRVLRRVRAERDAAQADRADALEAGAQAMAEQVTRLLEDHVRDELRLGELAAEGASLRSERDGLAAERDALQTERDALRTARDAFQADRDAARATLARIYAGRWWRLRGLLRRS